MAPFLTNFQPMGRVKTQPRGRINLLDVLGYNVCSRITDALEFSVGSRAAGAFARPGICPVVMVSSSTWTTLARLRDHAYYRDTYNNASTEVQGVVKKWGR